MEDLPSQLDDFSRQPIPVFQRHLIRVSLAWNPSRGDVKTRTQKIVNEIRPLEGVTMTPIIESSLRNMK